MKQKTVYHQLQNTFPSFNPGLFDWILRFELMTSGEPTIACMSIAYDSSFRIVIKLFGVTELPLFSPSKMFGELPYTPYDLGEMFIDEADNGVVICDELRCWRIAAKAISVEDISPWIRSHYSP